MNEILEELKPIMEELTKLGYKDVHVSWEEDFIDVNISINANKRKKVKINHYI